jgi:hypothetical protein
LRNLKAVLLGAVVAMCAALAPMEAQAQCSMCYEKTIGNPWNATYQHQFMSEAGFTAEAMRNGAHISTLGGDCIAPAHSTCGGDPDDPGPMTQLRSDWQDRFQPLQEQELDRALRDFEDVGVTLTAQSAVAYSSCDGTVVVYVPLPRSSSSVDVIAEEQ